MPIKIGQQFDKGLFWFGPTRLFITPGAGESGARARLFDPPEISYLRITY
jgi:predicted MPP superfamily phosphohydrolase